MSKQVNPEDIAEEELIGSAEPEPEPAAEPTAGRFTDNPLFNSEPNVPLGQIEREHDCPKWAAYLIRAGYKMTGQEGTPAIVDGMFGGVLGFRWLQTDRADEPSTASGGSVTALDGVEDTTEPETEPEWEEPENEPLDE